MCFIYTDVPECTCTVHVRVLVGVLVTISLTMFDAAAERGGGTGHATDGAGQDPEGRDPASGAQPGARQGHQQHGVPQEHHHQGTRRSRSISRISNMEYPLQTAWLKFFTIPVHVL